MRMHVVEEGEPLWLIGRQYGVSINDIIDKNALEDIPALVTGQALVIPGYGEHEVYPERTGKFLVHCSLGQSSRNRQENVMKNIAGIADYLTPEAYEIDGADASGNPCPGIGMENNNMSILARVSPERVTTGGVMEDNFCDRFQWPRISGVNLYFEDIRELKHSELREIVGKFADAAHREGVKLFITINPLEVEGNIGFYGEAADYVIAGTGEWGWPEGPPMSPAPIGIMERSLNHLKSVIPSEKLIATLPLYGLDWRLPYNPGGYPAIRIGHQQALILASKFSSQIQYDKKCSSCWFRYTDDSNADHEVWFEDIRSLGDKISLIRDLGLGGISLSGAEYSFPHGWEIIRSGK